MGPALPGRPGRHEAEDAMKINPSSIDLLSGKDGKVSNEAVGAKAGSVAPKSAGDRVELRLRAPRPRTARIQEMGENLIVYIDANVAVVRKPPGVSTVPFGDEPAPSEQELATLDTLVREVIARRDWDYPATASSTSPAAVSATGTR